MARGSHESELGLVRGPAAAAAAIALTAIITAFLPPATVLADPPAPTPPAVKAVPTPGLPAAASGR